MLLRDLDLKPQNFFFFWCSDYGFGGYAMYASAGYAMYAIYVQNTMFVVLCCCGLTN